MTAGPSLHAALRMALQRGLTFAAFRAPGAPVVLWAQQAPTTAPLERWEDAGDAFVLLPFLADRRTVRAVRPDVRLSWEGLEVDLQGLSVCVGSEVGGAPAIAITGREAFEEQVRAAKQAIAAGELEKVVLSRVMPMPLQRAQLADLFETATRHDERAMVALVHTPEQGTWLGASPERLLRAEDGWVWVDALAGTRADALAEVDAWGAKEREEQAYVTRHVRSVLEQCGVREVREDGPHVVRAGPVSHLRTVLSGRSTGAALSDLVFALHPTPAVCGTPTEAARAFIRQVEEHPRDLYTGAWGPWRPGGATELFVNIRCLRMAQDQASLFVGAGITAGSDPASEWEETARKADTWAAPISALQRSAV